MKKLILLSFISLILLSCDHDKSGNDHNNASHQQISDASSHSKPNAKNGFPMEPGQSAFGAIAEIVTILDNDPDTDWKKVNIEGLRKHLIDMNNVTLYADVQESSDIDSEVFTVTGKSDEVVSSIQAMVSAHVSTMNGVMGMELSAEKIENGMKLRVANLDDPSRAKVKGLGFIGIMTLGTHHQAHHLGMASGVAVHDGQH